MQSLISNASQVKETLKDAVGISITTDGWQSIATKSYLSVTAHWLDEDFVFQRAVLGVERLSGSHTHEHIGEILRALMQKYGIMDQVFHATTDNADSWVKAIREILGILHSRCFAHTLQLIVNQALASNESVISKARAVVSLFHHSSTKVDVFEALQKQLGKGESKLVTDVSTRWQSTYAMLKSVVDNQEVLQICPPNVIPPDKLLSDKDFAVLRELAAGLLPYYEVTNDIQGEYYPTMNELLPTWFGLVEDAEDYAKTRCSRGKLCDGLLKEMDKRSSTISSRAAALACLLDPRFRQLRFFGDDDDGQHQKADAMAQLREEYEKEKARVVAQAIRDEVAAEMRQSEGKDSKDSKDSKDKKDEKKGAKIEKPKDGKEEEKKGKAAKEKEKGSVKGKDKDKDNDKDRDQSKGKDRKAASDSEMTSSAGKKRKDSDGGADEQAKKRRRFGQRALKKYADIPGEALDEVNKYFSLPAIGVAEDPRAWWRTHKALFPVLSRVARKFLSVPATSAPVERVWSTAGSIVTKRRARLSDENLDVIVFLHENFDLCVAAAEEMQKSL